MKIFEAILTPQSSPGYNAVLLPLTRKLPTKPGPELDNPVAQRRRQNQLNACRLKWSCEKKELGLGTRGTRGMIVKTGGGMMLKSDSEIERQIEKDDGKEDEIDEVEAARMPQGWTKCVHRPKLLMVAWLSEVV